MAPIPTPDPVPTSNQRHQRNHLISGNSPLTTHHSHSQRITIHVHILTRLVLISEYGSDTIHLGDCATLIPYLIAPPITRQTTGLDHTITIVGQLPEGMQIRDDIGHNLYALHMHQIIQWINKSRACSRAQAYTAMMDFYKAVGLDIDDLPPERTHKRWQRYMAKKNNKNKLPHTSHDVPPKATAIPGGLNDCIHTAALVIQMHPEICMGVGGAPDPHLIRKVIMYAMSRRHRWYHRRIADTMGTTRQNVSKHIASIEPMMARLGS